MSPYHNRLFVENYYVGLFECTEKMNYSDRSDFLGPGSAWPSALVGPGVISRT